MADIPKRLSAVYVGMSRVEMVEAGEAGRLSAVGPLAFLRPLLAEPVTG